MVSFSPPVSSAMPCVIKPLAGSFVEAQYASNGTTRRKRSITSPSSAVPSSRSAQQSLFTSEKVRSSRTTPIVPPDHVLRAIMPQVAITFISQITNLLRPAQIRQANMTGIYHIQTPDRDLQFHLLGSVLKRRNMAARKRTVPSLPDGESRPT